LNDPTQTIAKAMLFRAIIQPAASLPLHANPSWNMRVKRSSSGQIIHPDDGQSQIRRASN